MSTDKGRDLFNARRHRATQPDEVADPLAHLDPARAMDRGKLQRLSRGTGDDATAARRKLKAHNQVPPPAADPYSSPPPAPDNFGPAA